MALVFVYIIEQVAPAHVQNAHHFFVTKRLSLPPKLGKPLRSTTTCLYNHTFRLNSAKC